MIIKKKQKMNSIEETKNAFYITLRNRIKIFKNYSTY